MSTHHPRDGRREVGKLLLAAASAHLAHGAWSDDDPSLLRMESLALGGSADALAHAARFHRLSHHLLVLGQPVLRAAPGLHEHLQAERARAVVGELQVISDLGLVAAVLGPVAPGWVVVKGVALGNRVYDNPVERPAGDLDVLVAPERFAVAVAALEDAGATVLDRNWTLLRRELRGQMHLVLPNGSMLDLHWHLLNRDTVRRDFVLPTQGLLERAVPLRVGPHDVRTLDPVDTVLHLCLHAAMSGGHRIGWLMDVQRSLRALRPDQDELVRRATSARARSAVGALLLQAAELLAAPVQADVVDRLVGPGVRAADRVLRSGDPMGSRWDDRGPRAWWTPTLRDRRAGHLSPRIRRQLRLRRRGTADAASALSEAPDATTRTDYLDAVASAARTS